MLPETSVGLLRKLFTFPRLSFCNQPALRFLAANIPRVTIY